MPRVSFSVLFYASDMIIYVGALVLKRVTSQHIQLGTNDELKFWVLHNRLTYEYLLAIVE